MVYHIKLELISNGRLLNNFCPLVLEENSLIWVMLELVFFKFSFT